MKSWNYSTLMWYLGNSVGWDKHLYLTYQTDICTWHCKMLCKRIQNMDSLPHSRSLQCIFSPLPFLLPPTHTKREVQGKKHSDRESTGGLLLSWGGMWVSWYAIGLGNCPDGGMPGAAHSPVFLQSLGNSIIYTLYAKFGKPIRHLDPYCTSLI